MGRGEGIRPETPQAAGLPAGVRGLEVGDRDAAWLLCPPRLLANLRNGDLTRGLHTSPQVAVFRSVNPISWQRLTGLPLREICILIKSSVRLQKKKEKSRVTFLMVEALEVKM